MHRVVERQALLVINGDYRGREAEPLRIFIVIKLVAGLDDATNMLNRALIVLVVRMFATILASLGTKMQGFYDCATFGEAGKMMMMG